MLYCPRCGCQRKQDDIRVNGISQCRDCKTYINSDGGIAKSDKEPPDPKPLKTDSPQNYIIAWAVCLGLALVTQITIIPAIVMIVIAFIKFPNHMAVKVLFRITMTVSILAVVAVIVLMAACIVSCSNCTLW